AQTDSLTGLVNRGAFTSGLCERLEAARAAGGQVALFIIDLDRFKALNDTLGHHAGDLLLAELGERLRADAADGELVARLGEDERRRALTAGGLGPWVQPVIDVQTGAITGREVLARWSHAEQGLLLPGAFVPVAEDLGLIRASDEAIFEAACAKAAPWVAAG